MFAPWKKSCDKPRQCIKGRDITLLKKVQIVRAVAFPLIMCGCESWTIKKVDCETIDAFKLWGRRRLFGVLWTARRSNHSILKEISPVYSLEGLMLKLQSFGHLMRRTDSFEKTLILGKTEGRRRRGWQQMRFLDGIANSTDMSLSKFWELVMDRKSGVLQSMWSQRVRLNWIELNVLKQIESIIVWFWK